MNPQTNLPAAALADLLVGWAHGEHGTLPQRLAYGLRCAVASGLLANGTRLPAERDLARALAVSRSTVTAALDLLRAEGLADSRQGSGTVVRGPGGAPPTSARIASFMIGGDRPSIDLAIAGPSDPSHLPPLSVDVAELTCSRIGTGYAPLGVPALRTALAERHTAAGQGTDAAQIHVTAGAHQAIALALGALAGPGGRVAVEEPNYAGIFDILDGVGARALPLDADPGGVRPAALDRLLRATPNVVVYLQTGPHNPTGRVPSAGRLAALAEVLDAHRATVVEDTTLADLAADGRPPEFAALCRRATVVGTGSLSKVAWGGLRIGWLRGPVPLVERTVHRKLATDLGPSVPAQLMALALLPDLDGLAARRRATLSATVAATLTRLRVEVPDWAVDTPAGGGVLWARLPVTDSGPFVALAGRHGVQVAPGANALVGRGPSPHIRICVDRPAPLLDAGLTRLEHAWAESANPRLTGVGAVLG